MGSTFEMLWSMAQWPVLTFLALFAFAILYYFAPAAIVLIGAEMNQVVEENIPGGKNKGEQFPDDKKPPEEQTG